jgi:hypothetical protein
MIIAWPAHDCQLDWNDGEDLLYRDSMAGAGLIFLYHWSTILLANSGVVSFWRSPKGIEIGAVRSWGLYMLNNVGNLRYRISIRRAAGAVALCLLLAPIISCGGDSKGKANQRSEDAHALLVAAYEGKADVVEELLGRGVDVNSRDEQGGTALIHAATWGRTDVVKVLLEHGADIDVQTDGGNTALIGAAAKGDADIVRMLLDAGADPLIKNKAGATAVVKAAFGAHSECVVMLKEAEVKFEEATGEDTSD